ncbi:hypothetical protein FisN_5Lh022 [Fistulifera solaris]|uniref:PI31 proteasome regulator N-terminal domain-containing protein n=1 Tax=Fistulifera solaris TaxID=1519565 RepID=A0A1Z5JJ87_FISSO|nr:hypothetical protein FisN_5Lh022 [Fistulifera solaris]|eukprot:GAX14054.1 hypothetical protein FisN_5Lh022 [Fistulifera solaris]
MTNNYNISDIMNEEDRDLYLLRDYILKCPLFSNQSDQNEQNPAIAAALQGIDRELRQRARDRVLHQKFQQQKAKTSAFVSTTSSTNEFNHLNGDSIDFNEQEKRVFLLSDSNKSSSFMRSADYTNDDTNMDDWEDVIADSNVNENGNDIDSSRGTTTTAWGKEMTQAAITTLAEQRVRVKEPSEAIVLLLHAVLLQHGFVCTGIPETAPSTGFAAPVRPLTTFLPQPWVPDKEQITLRYRNDRVFFLTVRLENQPTETSQEPTLHVILSQEPNSKSDSATTQDAPTLSFPLSQHFNLDSFAKATKPSEPILHYKQIADLLSQFGRVFDLGQYKMENLEKEPYVDSTVAFLPTRQSVPPPLPTHTATVLETRPSFEAVGPDGRPTFYLSPPVPHHPGDFAGDLYPSPQFPMQSIYPGNLMGPDHPMFQANGSHGAMSMQPRFDPFGPVVGDPRRQRPPEGDPRGRGSSRKQLPGEPNPDHLEPPNSFNSNMFM